MMKVKIFRNGAIENLERDINEFLGNVGDIKNTKTTLIDIKLQYIEDTHDYIAMVIFNHVAMYK